LYAANRQDRDQWVRILQAIADMNREGLNLETTDPLSFLRERAERARKKAEEENLTQT